MATKKNTSKSKKTYPTLASLKKGDTVFMYLFSGAPVGRGDNSMEVSACNEKTIMLETGRGKRKFSRATGVQVGAERPRYSSFILTDPNDEDGKEAAKDIIRGFGPAKEDKKAAATKAKKAKTKAAEVDEDDFEDADEEEEAPKAKKKAPAKKKPAPKAKKAAPPPEDDEDEDDFDDDDFDEDDE